MIIRPRRQRYRHQVRHYSRPAVEPMEARRLLSTIVVQTFDDVTEGPGGGFVLSLRNAIELARTRPGPDTIALPAGTYSLALGQFPINDPSVVAIQPLDGPVTIDALGGSRHFLVSPGSTLELQDLTLTGGRATGSGSSGGAIFNQGTLRVVGSSLVDNASEGGGGAIFSTSTGTVTTISGSVIRANRSPLGGGLLFASGTVSTITSSVIERNMASIGGGVYLRGNPAAPSSLSITASVIRWNQVNPRDATTPDIARGGGIYALSTASLSVTTTDVVGNTAIDGAGLYLTDGIATVLTSTRVLGNAATRDGGGVWNQADLTVSGSLLEGNLASGNGGALFNDSTVTGGGSLLTGSATFIASTLQSNVATYGGAAFNEASAAIALRGGSLVHGNIARADGGGFKNLGGLTILGSTLRANSADVLGGGISNDSGGLVFLSQGARLELNSSAISGGGLANAGFAGVSDSFIVNNTAATSAGGVVNGPTGNLTLMGSLVEGNAAIFGGALSNFGSARVDSSAFRSNRAANSGGGLRNEAGAGLTVASSLLEANLAASGGGAWDGGSLTLTDSTLRGNRATNGDGGGIAVNAPGRLQMSGANLLEGNSATGNGGGLATSGTADLLSVTGATFRGNTAANGGGLFHAAPATLNLSSSAFENNVATGSGGGAATNSRLVGSGLRFTGNRAFFGGGFANDSAGIVTFSATTFEGNAATNAGGAVSNAGALTLSGSTVRDNTSSNVGGGLANRGTASIADSRFEDNSASFAGGAASNFQAVGVLTVVRSQFLRNSASQGGALWGSGNSRTEVRASTLSSNTATSGGAIFLDTTTPSAIGGANPGDGNTVTGNMGSGLELRGANATVLRNTITGNTGDGIRVVDGSNHMIGQPGPGNTMSGNTGTGIAVVGATAIGNRIQGNAISLNGGLGIDLGGDGPTGNDPGDGDSGPNQLLNTPVITTFNNGSTTRIVGTYRGVPNATLTIDLYANSDLALPDVAEGQRWLASLTVTTSGAGTASFDVTLAVTMAAGEVPTATATDAAGNTSELSVVTPELQVQGLRVQVAALVDSKELRKTDGQKLTRRLDAVSAALRSGSNVDALRELNLFLGAVDDLEQKALLSPAAARALRDRARLLTARLGTP